jgi:transposase
VPPFPASSPPRLIPKSILGVSIWVSLLLDKYLFYRPSYRLLADWATHGLDLLLGTITDGLRHLVPLFEPVYEALVRRSQGQPLWHADETRWLVFATIEGKVGYRWYLGVFHSAEVVVFVLAAGRSHDVPEEPFGPVEGRGILVVDRYKAYQAIEGQERADRAGVLLGARGSGLPEVGAELAGPGSLGAGLGRTDRPVISPQ